MYEEIYNSFAKNQEMEQEYLRTINNYEKRHQEIFTIMFGELAMLYQEANDIIDILGQFYEKEHLGNSHLGQFFTPSHISDAMAEMLVGDENILTEKIEKRGFISVCEPTCRCWWYDTFFCKSVKKEKYKLSTKLICIC